jgi:hypothetical protein
MLNTYGHDRKDCRSRENQRILCWPRVTAQRDLYDNYLRQLTRRTSPTVLTS